MTEKPKLSRLIVIENQFYQFDKIYDYLEKFEVFPNKDEFKKILDLVRITLNGRYCQSRRDDAFESLISEFIRFEPDLFIIDHILVGNYFAKNGIDFVKELQKRDFKQPIIFLSNTKPNTAEVISNLPSIQDSKLWIHKGYAGEEILDLDYFDKHVVKKIEIMLSESLENEILKILEKKKPIIYGFEEDCGPEYAYKNQIETLINDISKGVFRINKKFKDLIRLIEYNNFDSINNQINEYRKNNQIQLQKRT